ncbi:hypothetical protein ACF0H5_013411 [Mactra antiquata]
MSAPPAKVKKAAKPKKPATHPKYSEMVAKAIGALKERGGSSRQAILKYIMSNFNVGIDANAVNSRLKIALRSGVTKGALKQSKGKGASGSFRLGEKPAAPKKKVAKKPKAKKPKAKKPAGEGAAAKPKKAKTPKKAKAAKPKKAKTPKKATKAAKPKKAAKSPKKAAKPKAKKSPKKAAKKAAKK